ncbi:hypothetical protein DIPPA_20761 [Diplonema papillatum]|nr:hypothetical protein DIPPA_20761 [Diplonema papillatum]
MDGAPSTAEILAEMDEMEQTTEYARFQRAEIDQQLQRDALYGGAAYPAPAPFAYAQAPPGTEAELVGSPSWGWLASLLDSAGATYDQQPVLRSAVMALVQELESARQRLEVLESRVLGEPVCGAAAPASPRSSPLPPERPTLLASSTSPVVARIREKMAGTSTRSTTEIIARECIERSLQSIEAVNQRNLEEQMESEKIHARLAALDRRHNQQQQLQQQQQHQRRQASPSHVQHVSTPPAHGFRGATPVRANSFALPAAHGSEAWMMDGAGVSQHPGVAAPGGGGMHNPESGIDKQTQHQMLLDMQRQLTSMQETRRRAHEPAHTGPRPTPAQHYLQPGSTPPQSLSQPRRSAPVAMLQPQQQHPSSSGDLRYSHTNSRTQQPASSPFTGRHGSVGTAGTYGSGNARFDATYPVAQKSPSDATAQPPRDGTPRRINTDGGTG